MERGPVGAEGNGLGSRLVLIDLTALHQPLQLRGDLLVLDLTPGGAGDGHAVVPIGDDCDLAGGAADGLTQLAGELGHAPHEGILFEDDPAVPVRVDFQRVTFPNTHRAADLLGDDHPAQVILMCQVKHKRIFERVFPLVLHNISKNLQQFNRLNFPIIPKIRHPMCLIRTKSDYAQK